MNYHNKYTLTQRELLRARSTLNKVVPIVKRLAYLGLSLALICQPVNAQQVANRVRAMDGQVLPGDLLIPGGIGAGVIIYQQINQPPSPGRDWRDPSKPKFDEDSVPGEGGWIRRDDGAWEKVEPTRKPRKDK